MYSKVGTLAPFFFLIESNHHILDSDLTLTLTPHISSILFIVFAAFSHQREKQLLTRIHNLDNESKRQNKVISRMRAIARAEAVR